MNIAGPILCMFLCFVGGIYSLWLLLDCYRQFRSTANRALATEMPRQQSRSARIDRLCQIVAAVICLVAVSGVFVTVACQHGGELRDFCQDCDGSICGIGATAVRPARRLYSSVNLPGDPVTGADFADLPMTDQDLAVLVRQHPQLEWLNLAGTNIGDSQLKHVAGLRHLEYLTLNRDPISDEGLQHLLALENLKQLDLYGTLISNDGLALISKMDSLEILDVCGTAITDAGLGSLHQLHHLRCLDVSKTRVSRHAVEELKNSLPGLEKLRHYECKGTEYDSKKAR